MHERHWQFRLHDHNVIDCAAFSKRASDLAAAMNSEVVDSKVIKIEHLRGNVRKIIGSALLQNTENNILSFRQVSNRHR
jgi:hypothetical protein